MKYIHAIIGTTLALGMSGAAYLVGYEHGLRAMKPHLRAADELLTKYEQHSKGEISIDYYLKRAGMRDALE